MTRLLFNILLGITTFVIGFSIVSFWNSISLKPSISASFTPQPAQLQKNDEYKNTDFPMLEMSALKVNGVGLDSSYAIVIKRFGQPMKRENVGENACAGGFSKFYYYSGLTIGLNSDEKGRNFTVTSMEINSQKWSVSGIGVGANVEDVKMKFKNHYSESIKDGSGALFYPNGDGWINFDFQNGKLVRISWDYNFC